VSNGNLVGAGRPGGTIVVPAPAPAFSPALRLETGPNNIVAATMIIPSLIDIILLLSR
jgi:hypothetical protein